MQKNYKLVGILNMFDIVPDFIYPVFENNGLYYLQTGKEETLELTEFIPLKESSVSKVAFLSTLKSNVLQDVEISLDSEPIFGFQSSEDYVYLGIFKDIRKFLQCFDTDDEILKRKIEKFLNTTGTEK